MLVEPNEPLVLADGTKIDTATGKTIREKKYTSGFVEVPSARQAQQIVTRTRRAIGELPLPPKQMNGISLVLFYTMWGLSPVDIAVATGLSIDQVKHIKELPEYTNMLADIKSSVLEHEANDIRGFMQANAMGAANKIVDLMEEEGALGFAAAKDVLDRAGHRPADVVEHRHKMEDELKIVITHKKADNEIPVIEGDYVDITTRD